MDRALAVVSLLVFLSGCAGLGAGPPATDTVGPTAVDRPGSTDADLGAPATVVDVVDGDTLDVRYRDGTTDTIRLLGVDTPEVHVENDPPEFEGVPDTAAGADCLREGGEAAGAAVRGRVAGERVRVVVDGTADRRDPYERLLAYVVHEGEDLNYWLVASGYARVYDTTFARADRYYGAEADAQAAGAGLWSCREDAAGS